MVPDLQTDTKGITWSKEATPGKALPIDQFYLAHADKDTAATINAALEKGKDLLLTPGIYHLESASRSAGRARWCWVWATHLAAGQRNSRHGICRCRRRESRRPLL